MIVYQHIILLWVLIIFKKTLRLGRTFIFYRFSQLFLSGFATFGMDTYIVQNSSEFFCRKSLSPSRWWRHPGCHSYSLPTFFLMMSQMKGPTKFSRNWLMPSFWDTCAHLPGYGPHAWYGWIDEGSQPNCHLMRWFWRCDNPKKGHRASWTCCISTVTYWHCTILMSH